MNIVYHSFAGLFGFYITKDPLFLLGSLLVDAPLIYNEYKLIKNKEEFNQHKVSKLELLLYRSTHSLFFVLIFLLINIPFALGCLTHQLMDWFTHKGVFNTMPFYPFKLKVNSIFRKQ